jgi:hypothetical protein
MRIQKQEGIKRTQTGTVFCNIQDDLIFDIQTCQGTQIGFLRRKRSAWELAVVQLQLKDFLVLFDVPDDESCLRRKEYGRICQNIICDKQEGYLRERK